MQPLRKVSTVRVGGTVAVLEELGRSHQRALLGKNLNHRKGASGLLEWAASFRAVSALRA